MQHSQHDQPRKKTRAQRKRLSLRRKHREESKAQLLSDQLWNAAVASMIAEWERREKGSWRKRTVYVQHAGRRHRLLLYLQKQLVFVFCRHGRGVLFATDNREGVYLPCSEDAVLVKDNLNNLNHLLAKEGITSLPVHPKHDVPKDISKPRLIKLPKAADG